MPEQRYLVGDRKGWLQVKTETDKIVSLPEYLRVDLTSHSNGRDYLTATEGAHTDEGRSVRGRKFSVKEGNLKPVSELKYRSAANLMYYLKEEELIYSTNKKVRAITHPSNPVPIGMHPLELLDFPHDLGEGYLGQSNWALSWFLLGTGPAVKGKNDRYLHTGRFSAGCITVDASGWNDLYRYLILCRSGNGTTVGKVHVVAARPRTPGKDNS